MKEKALLLLFTVQCRAITNRCWRVHILLWWKILKNATQVSLHLTWLPYLAPYHFPKWVSVSRFYNRVSSPWKLPLRCFLVSSLVRCLFTTFTHPRAPPRLHTLLLCPHFNPTPILHRWRYCYQSEDTENIIIWAIPCRSDTFCSCCSLFPPQLRANAPSRVWAHSWRFRGSVRPHALQTKVHFNSPITPRFNPAIKERASCLTSAHGVIAASKKSGNKTTWKMGKNSRQLQWNRFS